MDLTLLQWNIWYKEDIRHIAAFLHQHQPDIICLQELTLDHPSQPVTDTPAFIAKQLGYDYYHKEIPIEATDGRNVILANGIFTRFPIQKQTAAWINQPKGGGGYDDEYRAYVEVQLQVGQETLRVGTTHMSYTHQFKPTPNKNHEADQLLALLKKHSARFLFAGDLNALPGSDTIKSISNLLQNASPDLGQKTWTTKPFSYNGFVENQLNWRLDYIFKTPDIQTLSTQILQTNYSDHLPLLTTFRLS